jgi:hypothetical protein
MWKKKDSKTLQYLLRRKKKNPACLPLVRGNQQSILHGLKETKKEILKRFRSWSFYRYRKHFGDLDQ